MKRARAIAIARTGEAGAMKNWRYIALHTVTAGAFIFLLQRGRDFDPERAALGAYLFGGVTRYFLELAAGPALLLAH